MILHKKKKPARLYPKKPWHIRHKDSIQLFFYFILALGIITLLVAFCVLVGK